MTNAAYRPEPTPTAPGPQFQSALGDRSFTVIRTPISGVVVSVSTQEGETVAAGLNAPTFLTVVDLERLQVHALVDEVDIGKIEPGQSATFSVDAFPGRDFTSHVSRCSRRPPFRTTWWPCRRARFGRTRGRASSTY